MYYKSNNITHKSCYLKKAKYAIGSLMLLAVDSGKQPLSAVQIAQLGRIPKKYLEVILPELRNSGFLLSKKA
ncbi:Rrf2 family transcriptional regulator [Mucilaginibacter sp. X5P1]|uniref:Rrf2 family transcriptional regulator n=1 Tax=Mucilaginibacter sp. X5P1 TaxID=2723088 RepID=UPI00160E5305|nr:Rrf2 family transcriptional regulator [Mucilaginibacter sp. X5P1]MBB6137255.1 DNA-binding IscR family transcriptional regulator [Mucilaginibacter sp. X5P1]